MFFGITALILVGGSWCLIGAIMGKAPREGIDAITIQLLGGVSSILIGLAVLPFLPTAQISLKTLLVAGACYFAGGALNCIMLQLMSYSMQRGPNGIIWSIIQSALIFSFLGGIIFFGVELTWSRGAGIVLLAIALLLFGLCKDNSSGGGKSWKLTAFAALIMASVQQNLTTAPSYFPEARGISSMLRTVLTAGGTLLVALIWQLITNRHNLCSTLKVQLKKKRLWQYIAWLQLFSLIFSYLLLFPGIDALASRGAGAISYPLMVGSCIITFTLYSRFRLKEPMPRKQIIALLICTAGLVAICL